MRVFRLPDPPRPLAEVADRFHLTPLIRAMTYPHDVFVLALAEESVRLIHAFVNFPPVRLLLHDLPRSAEQATHRPSIHVRAPRGRLLNLEGRKGAIATICKKGRAGGEQCACRESTPLVLAAAEPVASLYRSVNTYTRLADEVIAGNPDAMTDANLRTPPFQFSIDSIRAS
jgi:hypothetical protein